MTYKKQYKFDSSRSQTGLYQLRFPSNHTILTDKSLPVIFKIANMTGVTWTSTEDEALTKAIIKVGMSEHRDQSKSQVKGVLTIRPDWSQVQKEFDLIISSKALPNELLTKSTTDIWIHAPYLPIFEELKDKYIEDKEAVERSEAENSKILQW